MMSEMLVSFKNPEEILNFVNTVAKYPYDMDMKKTTVKGEGLLARALLHEMDHLDGVLYVDKVEGSLQDVTANEEEQ